MFRKIYNKFRLSGAKKIPMPVDPKTLRNKEKKRQDMLKRIVYAHFNHRQKSQPAGRLDTSGLRAKKNVQRLARNLKRRIAGLRGKQGAKGQIRSLMDINARELERIATRK